MAANAIVIASTFRRTRESPETGGVIGMGDREYGPAESGVNGRFWRDMPDAKSTVLVTDPEYRKGEDCFMAATGLECRRAPDGEHELAAAVRDFQVRYVIVGNRQYAGALYDALPAGGVIARFGVGHDGIDKTRATVARLFCTNTPGVLDQSVAEHTMLLIAAASRRLTSALGAMASGAWNVTAGNDLHGKTLAVIGCGRYRTCRRAHCRARLWDARCRVHQTGCAGTGGHRSFRARDE